MDAGGPVVHLTQKSDHHVFPNLHGGTHSNRREPKTMVMGQGGGGYCEGSWSAVGSHGSGGKSQSPLRSSSSSAFLNRSASSTSSGRECAISMRKVLPPLPDMETQLLLSAKMIDKRTCTARGNHSYGPFFLEYSLLAEYNLLRKQKLPGVYVIPSSKTPLCWFGVIFIRQGIYQEGIFRFKIVIPENYPDGDCPRFYFDHAVFHPLVSPEAPYELDVRRGCLKKWRRHVNHIWQILFYARRAFYKVDTSAPLNLEAAHLYNESQVDGGEEYRVKVGKCVRMWSDRVYDQPATNDPHYLAFSPYVQKLHGPLRKVMLAEAKKVLEEEDEAKSRNCHSLNTRNFLSGHSFIEPGSLQIFSKGSSNSMESWRRGLATSS